MSSRISVNGKGQLQFAAPSDNAAAMPVTNTYTNTTAVNSGLQALVGKTIRGQVVGALEKWGDGSVWDTGNNRYLYAGQDFDPAVLNRT